MSRLLVLAALFLSPLRAASSPELLNPVLVVSIKKGYRVTEATAQTSLLFSVPTDSSSQPPLNLSSWSVGGGRSVDDIVRLAGAPSYVNGTDVLELPLEFDASEYAVPRPCGASHPAIPNVRLAVAADRLLHKKHHERKCGDVA